MLARKTMLLLTLVTLVAPGCVRMTGPEDVRRSLSRYAGVELEREIGFTVTRSGMWLARQGLKIADEDEISLKGVRRVEVGIYQVRGLAPGMESRYPLHENLFPADWTPWVAVRDEGEDVLVLVKHKGDSAQIRGLLVVVAEEDEWVLVRVKGNLEHIMEEAMRMAFTEVERDDLYDKTREERDMPPLDPGDPDEPEVMEASNEGSIL